MCFVNQTNISFFSNNSRWNKLLTRSLAKGITTLMFAAETGQLSCVEVLLANGANPTDRTSDNDSALLCACSFGYDAIARVLIDAGASALEALVVSCVQGKDATLRSLLEAGLGDVDMLWEELMVTPLAGMHPRIYVSMYLSIYVFMYMCIYVSVFNFPCSYAEDPCCSICCYSLGETRFQSNCEMNKLNKQHET
jgi:hypothetical protein